MIFNEPKSDIQLRMFIAEMLKDKIECDNYGELCEKAYKFIANGIVLPPQEKDHFAEAMKNLSSGLTQAMQLNKQLDDIANSLPKPKIETDEKEEELKNLYVKHGNKGIIWKGETCFICGYSTEFNYLIAGSKKRCLGDSISKDDKIFDTGVYRSYFYVPKDIVKE